MNNRHQLTPHGFQLRQLCFNVGRRWARRKLLGQCVAALQQAAPDVKHVLQSRSVAVDDVRQWSDVGQLHRHSKQWPPTVSTTHVLTDPHRLFLDSVRKLNNNTVNTAVPRNCLVSIKHIVSKQVTGWSIQGRVRRTRIRTHCSRKKIHQKTKRCSSNSTIQPTTAALSVYFT